MGFALEGLAVGDGDFVRVLDVLRVEGALRVAHRLLDALAPPRDNLGVDQSFPELIPGLIEVVQADGVLGVRATYDLNGLPGKNGGVCLFWCKRGHLSTPVGSPVDHHHEHDAEADCQGNTYSDDGIKKCGAMPVIIGMDGQPLKVVRVGDFANEFIHDK